MEQTVHQVSRLEGTLHVPTDKSISHRAFMISAIANGTSYVHHPLMADDVQRTMFAFRNMGIEIMEEKGSQFKVKGNGLHGLQGPTKEIDVGNSGTTIRLIMGLLAAQPFTTMLTGDSSIQRRPMSRVIEPLRLMGGRIDGRDGKNLAPLSIQGNRLKGIQYQLPIASAQVKSAILLAGLYADGSTTVIEPMKTRDHTERMLRAFGVPLTIDEDRITLWKQDQLTPTEIYVPGDISSAAYFITAALIIPGSDIVLKNVGINPTRTGFIDVLAKMGANIEIMNQQSFGDEPVADLRIKHQSLSGTTIDGDLIPRLIDEIPILAVLATQAEGVTEIRNAEELRVKESDRITSIATELIRMNAAIEELPDGLRITGKSTLQGANLNSYHDHRIAMTLFIAGLVANGSTVIDGFEAINISYPQFIKDIQSLVK